MQRATLARIFTAWRDARPALEVMFARSPILQEAAPLPADLSDLGTTGLEALAYLADHTPPPPEWRETRLARLAQAAQPKAAVEFACVPALRQLVVAAGELTKLKTMTPAE